MSGNVCTKSFPKKFRRSTTLGENGFVYYRRREFRDNFVLKNRIMLFNDYVVPYNKELLMRYNAHINAANQCSSSICLNMLAKVSTSVAPYYKMTQMMRYKHILIVVSFVLMKLFGGFFNSRFIQDIL